MDMSLSNSGSWWWTGRLGVLQSMASQRVGHNWVAELSDWLKLKGTHWGGPWYKLPAAFIRRGHWTQKRHQRCMGSEEMRCEDSVRGWLSASQGGRPREKSILPAPWSWTSSPQAVCFVVAAWAHLHHFPLDCRSSNCQPWAQECQIKILCFTFPTEGGGLPQELPQAPCAHHMPCDTLVPWCVCRSLLSLDTALCEVTDGGPESTFYGKRGWIGLSDSGWGGWVT